VPSLAGTFLRINAKGATPGDGYLYVATNIRDGRGSPQTGDDRVLLLVPAP
jgi:hypothetical protein